jgi:hypothetical protein
MLNTLFIVVRIVALVLHAINVSLFIAGSGDCTYARDTYFGNL